MDAVEWRANWRAATLPRRSALLGFDALRRRGLAPFSDGEMLAVMSIGISHDVPVVAVNQSGTPCAPPSHLPFASAIQLARSPPDVVAKRVMFLSVRRDPASLLCTVNRVIGAALPRGSGCNRQPATIFPGGVRRLPRACKIAARCRSSAGAAVASDAATPSAACLITDKDAMGATL
jgi:hypothetical protein